MNQAIQALVHETVLPASNAIFGLSGLGHNRRIAQAIATQQYDARTPGMFLRATWGRRYIHQSLKVSSG